MNLEPRFDPWVPESEHSRLEGVRLLILGESHYEEPNKGVLDSSEKDPNFTIGIVRRWGAQPEGRQRFFANLYEMVTGEPWRLDADHDRLWQHVWFYNYVQALVSSGGGKTPTKAQFEASECQFRSVLERVRPEAVIVMGVRLWQAMATQDEWVEDMAGALGRVCAYRLADGSRVFAAHTWHPSAPAFSPGKWHPRVKSYLADVVAMNAARA